ncbi:MAG: outer membrane protein transport protein [Acidobacteriota bacterium]
MNMIRAKLLRGPRLTLILALILVPLPFRLGADDLTFHEPSARATGLGGAFTARSDDATGLFYNPAGLAFLSGFRLKTNIMFDNRKTSAAWPDGGRTWRSEPSEFLGDFAVAWQLLRGVTVATGLFSPFNYESYWSPGWDAEGAVTRNRLRTLFFRTALAVEVVKGLAVSAGVDVVSSSLRWRHIIPFNLETYPLDRDIDVESSQALSGHGLGFTAGALWKVLPALQIGARFQQSVSIDYAGTDVFNRMLDISGATVPDPYRPSRRVSDLIDFYYATQNVTARLTLPREIACGIALTPVKPVSLYLDVQWNRWSGFGDWIFRSNAEGQALNPSFTPDYQEFYGLSLDYGVQGVALALRDTRDIKAGLEIRPGRYLALRTGYARLRSSVDETGRTPVYPDLERNVYSLGFGYEGPLFSIWDDGERVSDLSFDVFLRYASAVRGASAYPGGEMDYGSKRLVFGVGAGIAF